MQPQGTLKTALSRTRFMIAGPRPRLYIVKTLQIPWLTESWTHSWHAAKMQTWPLARRCRMPGMNRRPA